MGVPDVDRCMKCRHNEGVNERGECVHSFAVVPGGSATWKDTHCGHRCTFPVAVDEVEDHPYHAHVRNCESCSGPYGHCTEGLRLLRAPAASEGASEGVPERIWIEKPQPQRPIGNLYKTHSIAASQVNESDIQYVRARAYSLTVDEAARRAAEKIEIEFPALPNYAAARIAEIITTELKEKQ